MEKHTLAIYGALVATLVSLHGLDQCLADESPTSGGKESGRRVLPPHSRSGERHRKIAAPSKTEEKKPGTATAQPWFDVDPDRAVRPTEKKDAATSSTKSTVPTAKWEKDRFDFNYVVNGSNDFRQLPRFDINEGSQGLGGQMGVNLHF